MAELEDGIVLARVPSDLPKEQDINARTMDDDKFNQLVSNIKKRGTLEQLPYCALTNKGVEVVSGHHRMKAARIAGLDTVEILLDRSGLTRSAIAAKQLAHNAIEGTDDPKVLKAIAALITDVDDMLETALDPELFSDAINEAAQIPNFSVKFDFKTVQFTFLPEQLDNLTELCDRVQKADFEGVCDEALFDSFAKAVEQTKKFADTRNISSTISVMTKIALERFGGDTSSVTSLADIFGHGAIDSDIAQRVKAKVDAMVECGVLDNPWEVFDLLAESMDKAEIKNG